MQSFICSYLSTIQLGSCISLWSIWLVENGVSASALPFLLYLISTSLQYNTLHILPFVLFTWLPGPLNVFVPVHANLPPCWGPSPSHPWALIQLPRKAVWAAQREVHLWQLQSVCSMNPILTRKTVLYLRHIGNNFQRVFTVLKTRPPIKHLW